MQDQNMPHDFIDQLDKVSRKAIHLFKQLKDLRNKHNNRFRLPDRSGMSRSEKSMFAGRLKELVKVDLIGKVELDLYMFNPYYISPWRSDAAEVLWEEVVMGGLKQEARYIQRD